MDKENQTPTAGQWSAALDRLRVEYEHKPNAALEQQMIDLRIRAFRESSWPTPALAWPHNHPALPSQGSNFPEITPASLSAETLRSGIRGNGGLIVRGLMNKNIVAQMRDNIDRTLQARARAGAEPRDALDKSWYSRSNQVAGQPAQFFAPDGEEKPEASASVWTVDSPRTAYELIQFYHDIKLPGLLQEYFSEPAALSVKKWVLRRVAPDNGSESGWHQDGRFLGDDIRTVNMWIALSDCGGTATSPGIEMVGGRSNTIYPTGTEGAPFDWTVGQGLVDKLTCASPTLCPQFCPGDALFFDHYNLHRTAFGNDHTQARYALESWFFAASKAPEKQIPVFL